MNSEFRVCLGIDLGNQSTDLAAYDLTTNSTTLVDISGGYQSPSIPTVLSYLYDEKVFVIGHTARLMIQPDEGCLIENLLTSVRTRQLLFIGEQSFSAISILGEFIHQILTQVTAMNPRTVIEKVVITSEDILLKDIVDSLSLSLQSCGYALDLFEFTPNTKVLGVYFKEMNLISHQKLYLMDYGYQAFRLYQYQFGEAPTSIQLLCKDDLLSGKLLDVQLLELLTETYRNTYQKQNVTTEELFSLKQLFFQQYAFFFQKWAQKKDLPLYFTFAYPPKKANLTFEHLDQLMLPYQTRFEKNLPVDADNESILLVGNGLKMGWTSQILGSRQLKLKESQEGVFAICAAYFANSCIKHSGDVGKTQFDERTTVVYQGIIEKEYALKFGEAEKSWYEIIVPMGTSYQEAYVSRILWIIKDHSKDRNMTIYERSNPEEAWAVACQIPIPYSPYQRIRGLLKLTWSSPTQFSGEIIKLKI